MSLWWLVGGRHAWITLYVLVLRTAKKLGGTGKSSMQIVCIYAYKRKLTLLKKYKNYTFVYKRKNLLLLFVRSLYIINKLLTNKHNFNKL